jgi:hypothetical protein
MKDSARISTLLTIFAIVGGAKVLCLQPTYHCEEEKSSCKQENPTKVHIFDFLPARPIPVKLLELRWMIEKEP